MAAGAGGLGSAVGTWLGQVDPNALFTQSLTAFENKDTSEMAKLLKGGSLSEKGFMTGMVIEQVSNIANGLIANNKLSIQARERVQTMAMELAKQALDHEFEIQKMVGALVEKHQKMLEKITDNQGVVAKMMDDVNKRHVEAMMANDDKMITILTTISDPTRCDAMLKRLDATSEALKSAFTETTASLKGVVEAQLAVVETGRIDPKFFEECTRLNVEMVKQITDMTKTLAKQDEDQLNRLGGTLVDGVKLLIQAKYGPKEGSGKDSGTSLAVEDKSGQTASQSSSSSGGIPVVEDLQD